jgi:hypothetical protein
MPSTFQPRVPTGDYNPVMPPPEVLSQVGARLLDPATAAIFGTQRIRPTVYLADQLLVLGREQAKVLPFLNQAANQLGLIAEPEGPVENAQYLTVRLRSNSVDRPVTVDAWTALQWARAFADPGWANEKRDAPELPGLELNHLMYVTPLTPAPYNEPHPYEASGSIYTDLAYTGPRPVAFILGLPKRSKASKLMAEKPRRPIVAVVDTGCGPHPGLDDAVTHQFVNRLPGTGPAAPITTQREYYGAPDRPLDGLRDPLAGHGTFICGLVRQACPAADIVAVPVVETNGTIPQGNLLAALNHLATLVEANRINSAEGLPIDVVSVSMGYYHELPADLAFTSLLRVAVERLTNLGVVVVMSAGNDRTSREVYPAAFADPTKYNCFSELVLSVGALNPDGSSVALFSNSGPWVTTWQRGAAVVSTMPVDFQYSLQATVRTPDSSNRNRATVDGDNFSCGFGIASGTSYAAPVAAGRVADLLLRQGALDHSDLEARQRVVKKLVL